MRTNKEENEAIGMRLVEKLNLAKGKTALFIPLKGVSAIDVEGQPFYGPEEDEVLFNILKNGVNRNVVEVVEMNCAINEVEFAEAAAQKLIDMMKK